jgi:hypothetical protein
MSLGFEMMVLESVRERERMLVSSWIHEFFDHQVAFSKKKKKKDTRQSSLVSYSKTPVTWSNRQRY